MIDALKKTILAGIGATAVTAESIRTQLDEYVVKGRLSADEAREMAEKILDSSRSEFTQASDELQGLFAQFLSRANVATQHQADTLQNRLDNLTREVADLRAELATLKARSGEDGGEASS
ncbi:MAG: phasin family protein [Opitutales bacterium]